MLGEASIFRFKSHQRTLFNAHTVRYVCTVELDYVGDGNGEGRGRGGGGEGERGETVSFAFHTSDTDFQIRGRQNHYICCIRYTYIGLHGCQNPRLIWLKHLYGCGREGGLDTSTQLLAI